jgi:hypothetical protein
MKRILVLLTAVALIVALATGPVFAGAGSGGNCNVSAQGEQCQGGDGSGGVGEGSPGYVLGGGQGSHDRAGEEEQVLAGGFGGGGNVDYSGGGGRGYYCTYDYISTLTCVGGGGQGGTGEF